MLGLFLLIMAPLVVLGIAELAVKFGTAVVDLPQFFRRTVERPWPVLGAFTCLAGTGVLVYLFLSRWQVIWAVARKMIIEALHRKIVMVLLLFFAVVTPVLPFMLKAEGSLKSRVQIVLLYSLGLALVLMSLVAIFLATASICSEIERRYVHITDTKPALRWEFLAGKWLGVFVMCTAVLFVMAGTAYGLVRYVASRAVYGITTGARSELLDKKGTGAKLTSGYNPVQEEVFVARKVVQPVLDEDARQKYVQERLGDWRPWGLRGKIPLNAKRDELAKEWLGRKQTVVPGQHTIWEFGGLDREKGVTIRFKAQALGSSVVFGFFSACRKVQVAEKSEATRARYRYEPMGGEMSEVAPDTGWGSGSYHEFPLPKGAVSEDGFLYLAYDNRDSRAKEPVTVTFGDEIWIEAMQVEGSFLPNYYRSLIIFLCHIGLLAALGLMAGALFSFPVASLIVVCIFIGGMIAPWFHSHFVEPDVYLLVDRTGAILDELWRAFAGTVVAALPDFASFSPLDHLVHGKMVTWGRVAEAGQALFFVKGGIAMVVATFFYTRRELARIIV